MTSQLFKVRIQQKNRKSKWTYSILSFILFVSIDQMNVMNVIALEHLQAIWRLWRQNAKSAHASFLWCIKGRKRGLDQASNMSLSPVLILYNCCVTCYWAVHQWFLLLWEHQNQMLLFLIRSYLENLDSRATFGMCKDVTKHLFQLWLWARPTSEYLRRNSNWLLSANQCSSLLNPTAANKNQVGRKFNICAAAG